MKFHTRYRIPKRVLRHFDEHDNVDRISFIDSTALVQRMISEGKSLDYYRALSLRNGLYDLDDLKADESVPAVPVYQEDPVILSNLDKIYRQEMKRQQRDVDIMPNDMKDEKDLCSSDVDITESADLSSST